MVNYICENTTKDEMIAEILDNVVPFLSKGNTVIPNFGIGFYDLTIVCDDDADIRFYTTMPDNGNGRGDDIYISDYVFITDRDGQRDELDTAWFETENEIWCVQRTGGNYETIWGIVSGKYFVCDQYGDGVYLREPYDCDWDYETFKANEIAPISDEDREEIFQLWRNY